MRSIVTTALTRWTILSTLVLMFFVLGCSGDEKSIGGSFAPVDSNLIARQGVPIPPTLRSDRTTTNTALPDATEVEKPPDGVFRVVYREGKFTPDRIDVAPGDTVAFNNESDVAIWPASNIHPTHGILPEFDAGRPIEPGEIWLFNFVDSGFWRYHNHLLPSSGGLVVVSGSEAQRPPPVVLSEPPEFQTLDVVPLKDAEDLFVNDATLERYIETYGPARVVRALSESAGDLDLDCHQRAHDLGRQAYELFGAMAFSLSGHECHSGGYHGATEAFFHDQGTTNLGENVSLMCGSGMNAFFRHQCVHGIGHGLMAWTSYELNDALETCKLLPEGIDQRSCYSGVFMENVVGGLSGSMGHFTEYLSDDPHYPCNALDYEYVHACYFYQSSRMLQLFGGDFAKLAIACAEAPETAHSVCFQSMGRDVGGVSRNDPRKAITLCGYVLDPTNRRDCLEGAVQDSFWSVEGADVALEFCDALDDPTDRERCYKTIIARAPQIFQDREGLSEFCDQVAPEFKVMCILNGL
ncbi:MAG: hypothetical protein IIB17_02515 [Chloroflexi bacterium]|nr:hypothetical protein [Chloroflexota bacterium]